MVLLFMDMLGVKARWQQGRAEVKHAFDCFEQFVVDGLRQAGTHPIEGGIDSDAAALVFADPVDALRSAREVYLRAFDHDEDAGRYWIRGVVLSYLGQGLRSHQNLAQPFGNLSRVDHSEPLLDAIAVEQSGMIKGMRLVVSSAVLDAASRKALRIDCGNDVMLHPCTALDYSGYPADLDGYGWEDFLWMATADEAEWTRRVRRIRDKMRFSGGVPEEAVQAAATRVAFDQCRAILGNLGVKWG